MSSTADMVLERRRIRRTLMFWRVAAIVAIVIAIIAILPRFGDGLSGAHIAQVNINGIILDEPDRDRMIRDLAKDVDVEALVVRINSPGGTVTASESLYEAIRVVAAEKPVVAVMNEYAASGGYITAIASEYIIARGNTLTGSIGVVSQVPNVEGLLEILGVEVNLVRSAPLKGEPSFTQSPTPEALAAQETLILDMFGWFRDLVTERRGLEGPALARVTDGRAFTGRQALELGLIDAIGDEETARDWLAERHDIDTDTPLLKHLWGDDDAPWPLSGLQDAATSLGRLDQLTSPWPRLYALIQ